MQKTVNDENNSKHKRKNYRAEKRYKNTLKGPSQSINPKEGSPVQDCSKNIYYKELK